MSRNPTLVTVPCFSGAPWELEQLEPLSNFELRTMRLPEARDSIEAYADFVARQVEGLDSYVLIGDSFGAIVSLALAVRRPTGLEAVVLSGGFATDPVTNPVIKLKTNMSRILPGPLYRQLVLRFHADALSSEFDAEGSIPWTREDSRQLFLENTPWRSYVSRLKAAYAANYVDRLAKVQAPTLILTPEDDQLIGPEAARIMREGIPDARERVLKRTGHMFRFSHPIRYATAVKDFLNGAGICSSIPEAA